MLGRDQSLTRMQRNSVVSKASVGDINVATICVGLTPLIGSPA